MSLPHISERPGAVSMAYQKTHSSKDSSTMELTYRKLKLELRLEGLQ